MAIFCYKNLDKTKRLATKLREAREKAGLSISDLVAKTHINKNYIEAIERGEFKKLPKAIAFRKAYIKEYAAAVGLDQGDCMQQLNHEAGLLDAEQVHPHKNLIFSPFTSISTALRASLLVGSVVLFAGYLVWQIHGILQPPERY